MSATKESVEQRIDQLHAGGVVDFHFDLLIDLYEKRGQPGVLVSHFLPEFEAGDVGVLGVAIYVEDRYLPEMGLRVAPFPDSRPRSTRHTLTRCRWESGAGRANCLMKR